jgi:dTDP-4-amino-4,6-dideoxygalactose transaminase
MAEMTEKTADKLAILGGQPVFEQPPAPYPSIGSAELEAVRGVVESGSLSGFYGSPGDKYLGGPVVRRFEDAWSRRFGVPHTVSVNSATSGLVAALGAIGVGPGDEVIVPPYTMSATAIAPLTYGGIPVFADIEAETFCLDPRSVERLLSPRTRAILAVNLFGHPAELRRLRELADARGVFLIEDNAQGPLAREGDRYAGTIGHIGVFSLNYHKHIHAGEGGMCVTHDERLAQRLRMIRNHGENVVEAWGVDDLTNMIGANYRLTEMSAAVGLAQLEGADRHVDARVALAERLSRELEGLEGLTVPAVRKGCRHVYYVWAARFDGARAGVSRQRFVKALAAEGVPSSAGYVRPLYLLPLFQRRQAIGRHGFPFNLAHPEVRYDRGSCPVVERMHYDELLGFETCAADPTDDYAALVVRAFRKVHAQRAALAQAPEAVFTPRT